MLSSVFQIQKCPLRRVQFVGRRVSRECSRYTGFLKIALTADIELGVAGEK